MIWPLTEHKLVHWNYSCAVFFQTGIRGDPHVCWDCQQFAVFCHKKTLALHASGVLLGISSLAPESSESDFKKGSISRNWSMKPLLLYCSLATRRITPSLIWSHYCLTEWIYYTSWYILILFDWSTKPKLVELICQGHLNSTWNLCRRFLYCSTCLSGSAVDSAVPAPKIRPPAGIASPSWSNFS